MILSYTPMFDIILTTRKSRKISEKSSPKPSIEIVPKNPRRVQKKKIRTQSHHARIDAIQLSARERKEEILFRRRERENVFFSPAPVVVERIREREEDRCWPPKAGFNSLIRRERQGAENNRAFSRGTFQSSSSARRVVPFSIGGWWSVRRILKKSSRFVAFPSSSTSPYLSPLSLFLPFLSLLLFLSFFFLPRDPCIRAPPRLHPVLLLLSIPLPSSPSSLSLSFCRLFLGRANLVIVRSVPSLS